jgi:hypothetical protein
MSVPGSIRFPMACPSCSTVSATPSVVATHGDGSTLVILVCKRCKTESRFEMPASSDAAHMRSGVRLPIAKPPEGKS